MFSVNSSRGCVLINNVKPGLSVRYFMGKAKIRTF